MPVGGATDCGPEHYTDTQGGGGFLNVWTAQSQNHRQRQYMAEDRQLTHTQSQERNKNS